MGYSTTELSFKTKTKTYKKQKAKSKKATGYPMGYSITNMFTTKTKKQKSKMVVAVVLGKNHILSNTEA